MWWWAFCILKANRSPRFAHAARRTQAQQGERIDYYCWDLYARTSQWYEQGTDEEKAARKKLRYATLHEIEHGGNETAEIAELISTAVLRRHLETMLRLGIEYDFLPRESEILHLKFWEAAFEQLKQTGVLYFENEGKNKGCWVMTRPGAETTEGDTDEDAKVIVRSNGTVTYVGKDIAYHLWKFGLLGKDFGYKPFFTYPDHECWISAEKGDEPHPHFGGAQAIYNVIDSRQSDPQANVIQALRGMGYTDQADRYTHFSYEMVALTPRCAVELGYDVSDEDLARPYIEVSGRKGFGVKADDLIDKLIAATRAEVDARQTGRDEAERQKIAEQIAIGALALLHAQVHAQLGHRLRLQGCAELRGRDRPLHSIRRGPRAQHLPQGGTQRRKRCWRSSALRAAESWSTSAARETKTSGRCGCARRGGRWFWSSALQPPSRPTWPSTPSS